MGPTIGFNTDLAGSASYATASNANDDGASNNVVNPAAILIYASKIDPYNTGLLRRLQMTRYQLNIRNAGFRANPEINTNALAISIGKNYQMDNGVAYAGRIWQQHIMATIHLKDQDPQ